MTAPAVAAARFAMACGVGAVLGLIYGFLRPLRPRLTALADLIFVLAAFYGWLYLGFALCRGDLRFGYTAGMALGGFAWELTAGRLLRPIFSGFWKVIGKILGFVLFPLKKICEIFQKIHIYLLASVKKWYTIGWNSCRNRQKNPGGKIHGKTKTDQSGLSQVQPADQGGDTGGHRIVYSGAGDASGFH